MAGRIEYIKYTVRCCTEVAGSPWRLSAMCVNGSYLVEEVFFSHRPSGDDAAEFFDHVEAKVVNGDT